MKEAIEKAAHAAAFTVQDLRDALHKAGPVEALMILPMIQTAANLAQQVEALRDAVAMQPPVGILYADDREILQREGRAFIYAEPQTFTVNPDPGCVPVFARETP